MSVADEITKLRNNMNAAYDAVEEKGGTVPEEKTMSALADSVSSISGGGGTFPLDEKRVEPVSGDTVASASLLPGIGDSVTLPAKGEYGTSRFALAFINAPNKGPYLTGHESWPCPFNPFGVYSDDTQREITITINGESKSLLAPLTWASGRSMLFLDSGFDSNFPESVSRGYTNCAFLDFESGQIRYGIDSITAFDWDGLIERIENDDFPTITQVGSVTTIRFDLTEHWCWIPLGYFDSTTGQKLSGKSYTEFFPVFKSTCPESDIKKFCTYSSNDSWRPYCSQEFYSAGKPSTSGKRWSSSVPAVNQLLAANNIPETVTTGIGLVTDPAMQSSHYDVYGLWISDASISSDRATMLTQLKTIVEWLKDIGLEFMSTIGSWEERTVEMPSDVKALYDNAQGPITVSISGPVAGGVRAYVAVEKSISDYNVVSTTELWDIEEWYMEHGMDVRQDGVLWLQPKEVG